jgi:hypothetical protein
VEIGEWKEERREEEDLSTSRVAESSEEGRGIESPLRMILRIRDGPIADLKRTIARQYASLKQY